MQIKISALALFLAASYAPQNHVEAFIPRALTTVSSPTMISYYGQKSEKTDAYAAATMAAAETASDEEQRTIESPEDVSRWTYRELQRQCKLRGLSAGGTTAVLRRRLIESDFPDYGAHAANSGNVAAEDSEGGDAVAAAGISFTDDSDPKYEFETELNAIMAKSKAGHWKTATRKLKRVSRRYPQYTIPAETYLAVLETCLEHRLHGARAAVPARKIMEELATSGHPIPSEWGHQAVVNCLSGSGTGGTHDGFGGLDCALAMLSAMEEAPDTSVSGETYGAVVTALATKEVGSMDEAIQRMRAMVVDKGFTPNLTLFADVAEGAVSSEQDSTAANAGGVDHVMEILALVKASGYELDTIANAEAGRSILASGVIAAEKMGNLALGLRLLTAAAKAEGVEPDTGDDLVCSASRESQRAATLIHRGAIDRAAMEGNWKLAVRLLELMPQRSLTPSPAVWRKVVTTCAKAEKSRKATALLLDWVKLYERHEVAQPPIEVFNTIVNVCEICDEHELTLEVLEAMKRTHDTDGNLITFNIALKRLAKLGNAQACEGIIIGMLQAGIEPSVVSYTTAMAACVQSKPQMDSALAYEWLKRMKTRNVTPNLYTYNTALAACLDGRLESTVLGSTIATEMMADVTKELSLGEDGKKNKKNDSVIPNSYTKVLARNLMKQLRENWRSGDIDMAVAKSTVRVPLLKLVDFDKSEAAALVRKEREEQAQARKERMQLCVEDEDVDGCIVDELELEYSDVSKLHRDGARVAEV